MGMGVFRWILRLLLAIVWPRRRKKYDEDEEPHRRRSRSHRGSSHPGLFRIEVDNEIGRYHEGPAFSFWSSSRIILILSLLLWWIQPAGPMIAGYVGGRRAGAPWKAVIAALMPVFAIVIANYAYAHNFAARQIDFVASLPLMLGDGAASILPFLGPYRDFMITYIQGFVEALRTTFGMGTNGYLMVILFAYIGGLIGEQTRRELASRAGGSQSVGLNLPWPFVHARPTDYEAVEEEYEEDAVPVRHRHPVHAKAHPIVVESRGSRRRGSPRLEDLRKVPAEASGVRRERRPSKARSHRESEDEDDEEMEEESVRGRHPARAHGEARRETAQEERREAPHRESRPAKPRSRDEEIAIQRFVERALRNYDKTKL